MTTRSTYYLRGQRAELQISGSFAPAGAGAPTDVLGDGFTVVRVSAGLYKVTLDRGFPRFVSLVPGLQMAAAGDQTLSVGDTDATAGTFHLLHWDISGAALADIAADANARVHFQLVVRDSGV